MRFLTCILATAALFIAPASTAQDGPALADKETLQAFLPEHIGPYERSEVSASPFVDHHGWEDENGTTLTGLYEADGGQALVVALSHFRLPRHREELSMSLWAGRAFLDDASETTFLDYPAFEQADPPRLAVFVGETLEADAYPEAGEVSTEDLYAALEALDFEGLEALDQEHMHALRRAAEPDAEPTDAVTGIEGEVDCSTFNEGLKEETRAMMGAEQFVPWVHFLSDDEASTAEVDEDMVAFPKADNAWLQCVRRNDLLWAPLGTHTFLLRVKQMWELPDQVVFRTEGGGFTDVIMQGNIEVEAGGSE